MRNLQVGRHDLGPARLPGPPGDLRRAYHEGMGAAMIVQVAQELDALGVEALRLIDHDHVAAAVRGWASSSLN